MCKWLSEVLKQWPRMTQGEIVRGTDRGTDNPPWHLTDTRISLKFLVFIKSRLPEIWPPMPDQCCRRTRPPGKGFCRQRCSSCSTGSSWHTSRWWACYCWKAERRRYIWCPRTRTVASPSSASSLIPLAGRKWSRRGADCPSSLEHNKDSDLHYKTKTTSWESQIKLTVNLM